MSERNGGFLRAFFTALGGISGMISICLLIWKGGAFASQVQDHEKRIDVIESNGSTTTRTHMAVDESVQKEIDIRVRKLEDAVVSIQRDIGVISGATQSGSVKLDYIKDLLEEHKRFQHTGNNAIK